MLKRLIDDDLARASGDSERAVRMLAMPYLGRF